MLLLTAGSIFIQWNFYLYSVNTLRGWHNYTKKHQKNPNAIALTFDDGPALYTGEILDVLKAEQATATFFVIGKNIKGKENILLRMQEEGHVIGGHSFYHGFHFDWQSATRMQLEIQQTNEAITAVTGKEVKLFRPPYGVTNPNLAKAIRETGVISIGWNLRSMDTVTDSKELLLNRILEKIKPGSIILLHDSCAITARILPVLLKEIKRRGFQLYALHHV